jgi:Domain of unknown function (DUF4411)
MKRYCFDTSGISNPLETMPEDIHASMWNKVSDIIVAGDIAVTQEIYEEMMHIPGNIGSCIGTNKDKLLLEVGKGDWNWQAYVTQSNAIIAAHKGFISEYTGGSPKTVCLNDISIIALAKSLALPLVSMEKAVTSPGANKRHIPDVCALEILILVLFSGGRRLNFDQAALISLLQVPHD